MNIEIRKLAPDMADDYVRFFDTTPHDSGVDGDQCYCVSWLAADSSGIDFSQRDTRREYARKYVMDGSLQGYLAYSDGGIVGWCNANARGKCLNCHAWRWFMGDVPLDDANVKSVFCFVIKPEMYREGVATRLLERVCADAAADGFDYVEAYPRGEFTEASAEFMGPMAMYEKLGFVKVCEAGERIVMRKGLK